MAMAMLSEDEIACVYIPQGRGGLLVPQESVAEILRSHDVLPRSEVPDWLLGTLDWRGMQVPVISVGIMKGDKHPRHHCVVVINRSQNLPALPFYAISSADVPRLMRIAEEDLSELKTQDKSEVIAVSVQLGDDVGHIPRIDVIEEALLAFVQH